MRDAVTSLPLQRVADRCAQESDNFRAKNPSDEQYCFELFRRAVVVKQDDAWRFLMLQYERLVLKWVYAHPSFAFVEESAETIVNATFQRFWQALTPEKFAARFSSLGALLQYLKLCVGSTLLDIARAKQRKTVEQPIETVAHVLPSGIDVEAMVGNQDQQKSLWASVLSIAKTPQEQAILQDALLYDRAAAEIAARHPTLFTDVKQVYRVKENVLKRLRRNPILKQMAESR